jgi:hypothetical protein
LGCSGSFALTIDIEAASGWIEEPRDDLVYRALELAGSGAHSSAESVRRQLICEGYVGVRRRLRGNREFARLCRRAREARRHPFWNWTLRLLGGPA